MGTISLKVLKKEQYETVIAYLKELEEKQIISFILPEENSLAVPGEPVSDEEFMKEFDEAEKDELLSAEEAQQVFKFIKERVRK